MERVEVILENFDGKFCQTKSEYKVTCEKQYSARVENVNEFRDKLIVESDGPITVHLTKNVTFGDSVKNVSEMKTYYEIKEDNVLRNVGNDYVNSRMAK